MPVRTRAIASALFLGVLLVTVSSSARPVSQSPPEARATPTPCIPRDKCCRVCTEGKACGKACIAASKPCHTPRACACNESEVCAE